MTNKPDILSIIESYTELKKRGRYYWTLCPLPGHSEKTASFKIDPEYQSFHCFGCGSHGDVIDFLQRYHNITFKEALKRLDINGQPYRPDPKEIRKRNLLKAFRQWEYDYYDDLCALMRTLQRAKIKAKSEEDVESIARFYHKESSWLYQIELLQNTDDQLKFKLYQEVIHE
jgi:hypothetical protein